MTGLEPATSGVTGRHSNQLSYTRAATGGQGRRKVAIIYVLYLGVSSGDRPVRDKFPPLSRGGSKVSQIGAMLRCTCDENTGVPTLAMRSLSG